jgi:AcrR family transcriptional regulator
VTGDVAATTHPPADYIGHNPVTRALAGVIELCRGYRMTMVRDEGHFQRARRPEQKRQREAAILKAARELALREGIRNISLADIAREVCMHKTALLRYFETREEIYLRLAVDEWHDWVQALEEELTTLAEDDVTGVAVAFARTLNVRPLLCDLLSHLALNLERNVSTHTLLDFKLTALASVRRIAAAVRVALPDLTEPDTIDLVGGLTAIAGTLWQIIHPPLALQQLYRENPAINAFHDFVPTVTRFTETFILGIRARNNSPDF